MLIIDRFIKQMTEAAGKLLKVRDDPLLRTGLGAQVQAAKLADGFVFAESTMTMLHEKLRHFNETIEEVYGPDNRRTPSELTAEFDPYRGVWFQLSKPIGEVACLLEFVPSRYLSTGKDHMTVLLLNEHGYPVDDMEWVDGHGFQYHQTMHHCLECRVEYGVPVWCKNCSEMLFIWAQVLALSSIIAGQYLAAKKYEEKTSVTMLHLPRKMSGSKKKVPLTHVYRVIDANELIIPVRTTDETKRREERGSWIDDTVVYEEITTRPFTRTYRHPRYVNMKGQTVEFPNGIKRLQPRKVENLGKSVTKVKASRYEEK